jgi:hypothetical protein
MLYPSSPRTKEYMNFDIIGEEDIDPEYVKKALLNKLLTDS